MCSRFPFFSADVLASNAMILQALIEGGWNNEKEDEDETKDKSEENDMPDIDEDSLFSKPKDDQEIVQSALNSQNVSLIKIIRGCFPAMEAHV